MAALLLAALVVAAAAVPSPGPTPELPAGARPGERLVIPDQLFLTFRDGAEEPSCADAALALEASLRAQAALPVAFADAVDLVGHVEAVDPDGRLRVLGRRVAIEAALVQGGGRDELAVGALVRVRGEGAPDGSVRADKVGLETARTPESNTRLERELAKFRAIYWKKAKRLEDPLLSAYVQRIVDRLTPSYLPEADRRFSVILVRDPDLNAFALPDGTLVVHSGLLARLDNEAQLAAVLGHEMAHASQRHALRALERETEHKLVGWGSLLAALALGVAGKGDAAQGVQLMGSAWLSGYSRAHEDEADQVGLRYLYLAGYDVGQAAAVWRTFRLLYGDPSSQANFFYGSHSTGREREHNLAHEVWKSYEPAGLVGGRVAGDEYLRATAGAVRENALLDLARGNLAWAEWGLNRSLGVAPDDPDTHLALGRLRLRSGGRDGLLLAAEAFARAVELRPDHGEAQRELGLALERLGERDRARAALERYLELVPDAADAAAVRRVLARI